MEFLEQHFDGVPEVDSYLHYVESTYIGLKNRLGVSKNPRNIYTRNLLPKTLWNACFNRTNHNVLQIIRGFMAVDALAVSKFHEEVVGKSTIRNPGPNNRLSARYENLRT